MILSITYRGYCKEISCLSFVTFRKFFKVSIISFIGNTEEKPKWFSEKNGLYYLTFSHYNLNLLISSQLESRQLCS